MAKNKIDVFHDEFVDVGKNVMKVDDIENRIHILIYVYDDPYSCYYYEGNLPDNKMEYERDLFNYLSRKYPECWSV